jgi:hypothetical protein
MGPWPGEHWEDYLPCCRALPHVEGSSWLSGGSRQHSAPRGLGSQGACPFRQHEPSFAQVSRMHGYLLEATPPIAEVGAQYRVTIRVM